MRVKKENFWSKNRCKIIIYITIKRLIKVLKLLNKNEVRLDHDLYDNWLFLTLIPFPPKKRGKKKERTK